MMKGLSSPHHHHGSNNISHGSNHHGILRQFVVVGLVLMSYVTLQIFYSQAMAMHGYDGQQTDNDNAEASIIKDIITSTQTVSDITIAATTSAHHHHHHDLLFSLAYEQSYGFFTDISNEDWKRRQTKARQHRHHQHGDPLKHWNKPNTPASMMYYYNYEPLFTCPHVQRVGGPGDGPKWTCDPHRLINIAAARGNIANISNNKEEQYNKKELQQQVPQTPSNNNTASSAPSSSCLIYSIGSAGVYVWEDGLYQLFGPNVCEFHIFDPGHYDRPKVNAQRNMHYHSWGITSSYHPHPKSRAFDHGSPVKNGRYKTLDESMQVLHHTTNRTIDILKVDCEYCEWFSYQDWIRHGNVRQLLIETHHVPMPKRVEGVWPWPGTNMTPNQFFDDLQRANYIMFSKEPNIHQKNQGNLVEWSFIRLHPDFLHGP